jgi:hypothetical protein
VIICRGATISTVVIEEQEKDLQVRVRVFFSINWGRSCEPERDSPSIKAKKKEALGD